MTEVSQDANANRPLGDKIILITGAGDGIGRAVAKACATAGATIILLGRTVKKLERVYDEIVESGAPQPAIYPLNLEKAAPEDYDKLAEVIETEFGQLDGLLHNAASLGVLTPLNQYNLRTWYQVMQTNLNAPLMLTQCCLPLLNKSDAGVLIFTTDGVGARPKPFWGAYGVSKSAIDAVAEILASELENSPLRIHLLDPGKVRTELRAKAYPGENPNQNPTPDSLVEHYVHLFSSAAAEAPVRVTLPSVEN
jgi:NAD(P)-dependent dehydrogenase (short-subunit alcohol dehydrogenase family)